MKINKPTSWLDTNKPLVLDRDPGAFNYITFSFRQFSGSASSPDLSYSEDYSPLMQFFLMLEKILHKRIPHHTVTADNKTCPPVETKELYAVFHGNMLGKSRKREYLSFPGEGSREIYAILFDPLLVKFCKQGLVVLERIDFCLDAKSGVTNFTKARRKQLNLENIFSEFYQLSRNQIEEKTNEKGKKENRVGQKINCNIDFMTAGLSLFREEGNCRLDISSDFSDIDRIKSVFQMKKAKVRRFTTYWHRGDSDVFLQESLKLVVTQMHLLVRTQLTEDLLTGGKNQIKRWLHNFVPRKASVLCLKAQDKAGKEFLLQDRPVYPIYLAVLLNSFAILKEPLEPQTKMEILEVEILKKTAKAKSDVSLLWLDFNILELLESLGWGEDRYYVRKMFDGLISLKAISIIQTTNSIKSLRPLILNYVFDKKRKNARLLIDISLLKKLWDKTPIHKDFYKTSIENYQDYRKGFYNVGKIEKVRRILKPKDVIIPSYVYPILSETYASISKRISYNGKMPKDFKSFRRAVFFVRWLFSFEYTQRKLISQEELKIFISQDNKMVFKSKKGSFQIKKRDILKKSYFWLS